MQSGCDVLLHRTVVVVILLWLHQKCRGVDMHELARQHFLSPALESTSCTASRGNRFTLRPAWTGLAWSWPGLATRIMPELNLEVRDLSLLMCISPKAHAEEIEQSSARVTLQKKQKDLLQTWLWTMQSIAAKRSIQGSTKQVGHSHSCCCCCCFSHTQSNDLHMKQQAAPGQDSPKMCVTRTRW